MRYAIRSSRGRDNKPQALRGDQTLAVTDSAGAGAPALAERRGDR
jgi:hypothetical protein